MRAPKVTITGTVEFADPKGKSVKIVLDRVYIFFPDSIEEIDLKTAEVSLDISEKCRVVIERVDGLWVSGRLEARDKSYGR